MVDLFRLLSLCRVGYLGSLSLPRGASGWSVPVIVSFPGHTHVCSFSSMYKGHSWPLYYHMDIVS